MIIEFCKMEEITPKGCHFFEENHVIPSGFVFRYEIFYNPAIPSGLNTA